MQCLKSLKVLVTSHIRATGRAGKAGRAFVFLQFYSNIRMVSLYLSFGFLDATMLFLDQFFHSSPSWHPEIPLPPANFTLLILLVYPNCSSVKQRQPHIALPSPTARDRCRLVPSQAQCHPLVTSHWELQVTGRGAGFCVRVSHSGHCPVSVPN